MGTMSPSSSPRLPSPPPMAEDQLGPKSPVATGAASTLFGVEEQTSPGAIRRIRPGTKSTDMPEGPPLEDFNDLANSLQLNDYLRALYNDAIHPKDFGRTIPIDRQTAIRLASPPRDVDRAIWLYELCRFLCEKVNTIITALFADSPPCSAITCNEMRASEWQYLCAVHDPPKPCCAIDYCCHTLDWAANVLTSPKHFPSRLTLGYGMDQGPTQQQTRQLTNIFRRVYRIFAHAWFQHRDMFWKVESHSGLYVFFKTVCDVYGLIPEDNYTVPPEAEGTEPAADSTSEDRPTILQRPKEEPQQSETPDLPVSAVEQHKATTGNLSIVTGHTTKRHRQTPSVDAGSISTVMEENEEEDSKDGSGPAKSGLGKAVMSKGDNLTPDTAVPKDEPTPVLPRKLDLPSNTELPSKPVVPIQQEPESQVSDVISKVSTTEQDHHAESSDADEPADELLREADPGAVDSGTAEEDVPELKAAGPAVVEEAKAAVVEAAEPIKSDEKPAPDITQSKQQEKQPPEVSATNLPAAKEADEADEPSKAEPPTKSEGEESKSGQNEEEKEGNADKEEPTKEEPAQATMTEEEATVKSK